MKRPDAQELLDQVLDPGTWTCWDTPPGDEAVVTGSGVLRGHRVALVVSEFGYLAGSIGVATAARVVSAVERATAEGLPLLAAPASGGTRMQEGTVAFVQMARIAGAVMRHRTAGLPYLVYLRHPTTGGVLASWGSLGHITAAEPGALIGFLGPRVYEALHGEPFPPGVQLAENLQARGLVDAVVDTDGFTELAARALNVMSPSATEGETVRAGRAEELSGPLLDLPAWESVERSRRPDRPDVAEVLRRGARDLTMLSGTGDGEADAGVLLALARFGSARCVIVGQRSGRPPGPAGLRVARRGMRLAAELRLPLVTVVDTPGAVLSAETEERGLAGEIARCLADLMTLDTPTLCLLLGEGSGGAALALLPADRVLCAQHGWLSPLPPEGASAIVHRTVYFAAEMAQAQRVRSVDLLRDGIIDRIIPELPDAADEAANFCARVAAAVESELEELGRRHRATLPAARDARYRHIGGESWPVMAETAPARADWAESES